MERRKTKKIKVGNIYIGGDAKITVQSMLNRPASDIEGSVRQAVELEKAGCEIIRAAVPDMQAVKLIEKLKEYKRQASACPLLPISTSTTASRSNALRQGSIR